MKLINKVIWKNGGGLTFLVILTVVLLVSVVIYLVKPVVRDERISNIQKNIIQMCISFQAQVSSVESSCTRTILKDTWMMNEPDSVYALCEHLARCHKYVRGASIVAVNAESVPTVIVGDTICRFNARLEDFPLFARTDSLISYFDGHNDRNFRMGRVCSFPFLEEHATPVIVPLTLHENHSWNDRFVILYALKSDVRSLMNISNPYIDGKIFVIVDSVFMNTQIDTLLFKPAYPWLRKTFGEGGVSSIETPNHPSVVNVISRDDYTWFVGTMIGDRTILYILPTASLTADLKDIWIESLIACAVALIIIFLVCYHALVRSTAMAVSFEKEKKDMETAEIIQKSMLSAPITDNPCLDIDTVQISAKLVGGDLYFAFERLGMFYFCIGDVSGKGMSAAMFMSKTVSLFRNITRYAVSPADVADQLNVELVENNEKNMFVTMFIGIFNMRTGMLGYCNAGHDEPLYWNGNASQSPVFLHTSENLPLGVYSGLPFYEGSMQLNPGSVLMLYTDGVNEAMNAKSEQYGEDRLLDFFSNNASLSSKDINSALINDVRRFVGDNEQSDDITIVTLKVKALTS